MKDAAKILLELKAVSLNPKQPFKYSSRILSPIYTDCRILMSYPKQRQIIRDLYIEEMEKAGDKFDVIAGTATAGIPHAAWIADKLDLPMVYVRGSAKDHGKGNKIEGVVKKGQKVAVIEDLISTGESAIATASAIRDAGGEILYIFSIMTYSMKKSTENFSQNSLKLITLTNIEELVNLAVEMDYIKEDEKEMILDWTKDPATWGKKQGFE